jgi:hypothetical protein
MGSSSHLALVMFLARGRPQARAGLWVALYGGLSLWEGRGSHRVARSVCRVSERVEARIALLAQ